MERSTNEHGGFADLNQRASRYNLLALWIMMTRWKPDEGTAERYAHVKSPRWRS